MSRGPILGTVKYNGWEFPGPCIVNLKCSSVRDTANRVTKYFHYLISITTTIVPSDAYAGWGTHTNNDTWLGKLRSYLMKPSQRLIVTGHGLGNDIDVDSTKCIGYGPVPLDLECNILGSNLAAQLKWTVEFNATHCTYEGITGPDTFIGDLSYGISYNIDDRGLTTRTVSGKAEVAVFLNPALTNIDATSDELIDLIAPALPDGFVRHKTYTVSNDKRFLDFTITDTELGTLNSYPQGIIKSDLELAIDGDITMNAKWNFTLSGSMEVAQGINKGWAVYLFLGIALAKVKKLNSNAVKNEKTNRIEDVAIIRNFNLRDYIYSPKIMLSVSYTCTTTLDTILTNGGTFDKVGEGWYRWRDSEGVKRALGPRGSAQLRSKASDEPIITFCRPGLPTLGPQTQLPEKTIKSPFTGDTLTKENSWIKYDVHTETEKYPDTIYHRPAISSGDSAQPLSVTSYGSKGTIDGALSSPDDNTGYVPGVGYPNPSLQERSNAEVIVVLTGHAQRVGFPIEGSDLAIIGTPGSKEIEAEIIGPRRISFTAERQPIYDVRWRRVYRVLGQGKGTYELDHVPKSRQNWITYPQL